MPDRRIRLGVLALFIFAALVAIYLYLTGGAARLPIEQTMGLRPTIAAPDKRLVPVIVAPKAVGWAEGATPTPAAGLAVGAFATGLDHPRWLLVLDNGDVLVAETRGPDATMNSGVRGLVEGWLQDRVGASGVSANRITLLRDTNGDGKADLRSVLLDGLNAPFGMAVAGDHLYVGNTDALVRFPFKPGETRITATGEKIMDLPTGGHWTRNVVANADGSRLYVTVGSATNAGERGLEYEKNRAAVFEVYTENKGSRIFAAGMRDPVGLAWEPESKRLWGVVNERDELGSDLVPDFLTEVEFGGHYGWPWYYWRGYPDPRVPEPDEDMRQYLTKPDYALGAHTTPLGLAFATGARLGPAFASGAFIGLHGSWNRRPVSGYKVVFVPFAKGRPTGLPRDVLTGFLDQDGDAQGRPAGVAIDGKGGLLVADDVGNHIWRVTAR